MHGESYRLPSPGGSPKRELQGSEGLQKQWARQGPQDPMGFYSGFSHRATTEAKLGSPIYPGLFSMQGSAWEPSGSEAFCTQQAGGQRPQPLRRGLLQQKGRQRTELHWPRSSFLLYHEVCERKGSFKDPLSTAAAGSREPTMWKGSSGDIGSTWGVGSEKSEVASWARWSSILHIN